MVAEYLVPNNAYKYARTKQRRGRRGDRWPSEPSHPQPLCLMPPSPPINPRPIATLFTRGVVVDFFLDLRKQRLPTTSEAEEYYCRDAATKATEYKDTPVRTLLRKISSTMTNGRARAVFPIVFLSLVIPTALGWIPTLKSGRTASALHASTIPGSIHGQNACFLPLKQLDQDYYAPRIVQVRRSKNHIMQ